MSLHIDVKMVKAPSSVLRSVVVVLCLALGVVLLSGASAFAAGPYVSFGSFGGEGSSAGLLKEPAGVAVNEAQGYVYVVDKGNNRVERFSTTGAYEGQFTGVALSAPEWVAVDNSTEPGDPSAGDVYVADSAQHVIDKFSAEGAYLGQLKESSAGASFGGFYGVAVDPAGELWVFEESGKVYNFSDALVNEYQGERESPYANPGFAVDSEDNLYVMRGYGYFAKLNSAGGVINEEFGTVGEEPKASAAAVDFSNNDVYLDNKSSVGLVNPGGGLIERFAEGSLSEGTGIAVDRAASGAFPEGAVYVADGASNTVQIYAPKLAGAPEDLGDSVSTVTGTSATFEGQADPVGASTTSYFRYGTVSCKSDPAACSDAPAAPGAGIGSGFTAVTVPPVPVQGLEPDTTYYYELIAVNGHGEREGAEHTFTTQPVGGAFALPDRRGFEMVSPLEKNGGDVQGIDAISSGGVTQAAASGEAVTFLMGTSLSGAKGAPIGSQYVSRRSPEGWSTEDIDSPTNAQSYNLVGLGAAFKQFSTELDRGLEPNFTTENESGGTEDPQLSPEAPVGYQNLYVRDLLTGAMTPVMTESNSTRTLPANKLTMELAAASPNLEHVVFYSNEALVPGGLAGSGNVYEWTDGAISPVSILPGATQGGPGSAVIGSVGNAATAVSENGSRVAFTKNREALYVRIGIGTPSARTVQVDADHGGGESGEGHFMYASSDMSQIFFTDPRKLTADASAFSEKKQLGDLYDYNVETNELTDLTADTSSDRYGASVVGFVDASTDGSYVYFVANGRLAEGATAGNCSTSDSSATAMCNLYVEHDDTVTLVSHLSGADGETTSGSFWLPSGIVANDWAPKLVERSVRVSPDGQELLFMSHQSLTGYDNSGPDCLPIEDGEPTKDEYTPGGCAELYMYFAGTNHLSCISCNPSGAIPGGPSGIPPATGVTTESAFYQSRALTDEGKRVFFESADALSPADTNHRIDVYEWEADGTGSCASAADAGGCVFLISGGKSSEDASFVDASESGDDVFFTTRSELVPSDDDQLVDLYDARVGGGPPAAVAPPVCEGTGCQGGTPVTPIFATPPSVTFNGVGNFTTMAPPVVKVKQLTRAQKLAEALKACKKQPKKRLVSCERAARARYGPLSKAKKSRAGKTRRGGR